MKQKKNLIIGMRCDTCKNCNKSQWVFCRSKDEYENMTCIECGKPLTKKVEEEKETIDINI
jgi:ribosomal protein S27E